MSSRERARTAEAATGWPSSSTLFAKRVAFDERVDELKDLAPLGGRKLLDLFEAAPQSDVLGRVG